MRKCLLFALVFTLSAAVHSYGQSFTGKVKGENGAPAAGVTVYLPGSKTGVTTRADGSFTIKLHKLPDTLVFSSVSHEPYKVVLTDKVAADKNFEVVLLYKRAYAETGVVRLRGENGLAASAHLDEVVVTSAYSTKRKRRARSKPSSDDYYYSPAAVATSSLTSAGVAAGRETYTLDSIPTVKPAAGNRILTAGEVNDFYKWKLWSDLGDKEFKEMGDYWGMWATQRYMVQLQNSDHIAMVNQTVYLKDAGTNEVVWTAVTDNTGKAELWAGMFRKADSAGTRQYKICASDAKDLLNPVSFSNGINHLQMNKSCGASKAVDIAFVVDATGSMGDEINFLKFELEDVIRNTYNRYSELDLKVGSVFYRDKGDEYVTRTIDFQSELLKVLNFVKLQSAGGGGDEPEAVDSALHVALSQLHWRTEARARLLFLFLDAPPHDDAKKDMTMLISRAAAMGVRIIPIACSGSGKKNEYLLRSMALATNGTYAFLTDHSGVGGKHTEPTTDNYQVELLNQLMQRVVQQYVYAKDCPGTKNNPEPLVQQPSNIARIKIYPNPTQGPVTIESDKEIKELYVSDFTGKILFKASGAGKTGKWQIDISQYPAGTYFIRYITKEGVLGAEKLILVH